MKVALIDNGSTLLEKLEVLIPGGESVTRFDALRDADMSGFDLIVLSGGSVCPLDGNEDRFSEEMTLIKNTEKPLIGICFGLELIVKSFGGSLKRLDHKCRGLKEVVMIDDSLCDKDSVSVYESHEWGIDRMPEDFLVLARSAIGPEIIKHKTLPIYGFQFHPENFMDGSEGDEIFLRILSGL